MSTNEVSQDSLTKRIEWKLYGSGAKWFASLNKIFNRNLKVSKKN